MYCTHETRNKEKEKNLVKKEWKAFIIWLQWINRSSRPEVFCKKGVLRNFTKFTGKHLRQSQSLFFNKVDFIKKETLAEVFSCEFYEIFKNTFSYRIPLVAASQ